MWWWREGGAGGREVERAAQSGDKRVVRWSGREAKRQRAARKHFTKARHTKEEEGSRAVVKTREGERLW